MKLSRTILFCGAFVNVMLAFDFRNYNQNVAIMNWGVAMILFNIACAIRN